MREALSAAEVERYHVEPVNVPFTAHQVSSARNCTAKSDEASRAGKRGSARCGLALEVKQRQYMNELLLREVGAAAPGTLVHVSDVDELLDPDAVRAGLRVPRCVLPLARMYVYGERCAAHYPRWAKSVLFNVSSGWLEGALKAKPGLQLRNMKIFPHIGGPLLDVPFEAQH